MTRGFCLTFLGATALLAACASAPPPPAADERPRTTSIEIAELEISDSGSDRFTSCPPPGELGQKWIPPIPAWTAIASSDGPTLNGPSSEAPSLAGPEVVVTEERGRAEKVIVSTRGEFRRCYHRGLFYDPTQDGHVAIALRVDKDGRVAKVESYGACDLSSEVLSCMRATAATLRFEATGKADTIVVPIVFAGALQRHSRLHTNDAYAAEAYVAIEAARPALHACAAAARKEGKAVFASAALSLEIDEAGKVAHAHVDNWIGDQDVLTCAAEAVSAVVFPAPPAGKGQVVTRLTMNPRPGTK